MSSKRQWHALRYTSVSTRLLRLLVLAVRHGVYCVCVVAGKVYKADWAIGLQIPRFLRTYPRKLPIVFPVHTGPRDACCKRLSAASTACCQEGHKIPIHWKAWMWSDSRPRSCAAARWVGIAGNHKPLSRSQQPGQGSAEHFQDSAPPFVLPAYNAKPPSMMHA